MECFQARHKNLQESAHAIFKGNNGDVFLLKIIVAFILQLRRDNSAFFLLAVEDVVFK